LLSIVTNFIESEIRTFKLFLYIQERVTKQGENTMAFLMLSSQKSLLTMRKNDLQYQYSCLLNQVQNLKKEEADHSKYQEEIAEASGTEWDMDADGVYQALVKEEERITVEADSFQSQIQIVDQEIAALKQLVQTDVKQATQLSLLGGS